MRRRQLLGACGAISCGALGGPQASAALALGPGEIVVGQTIPTTGPFAPGAVASHDGAMAFFEALNAEGGIHGRRIRVLVQDDQLKADLATRNAREFAAQGAICLFQPYGTNPRVAVGKVATELHIPMIAPISGAAPLYEPSPFVFNTRASFRDEYEKIVQHLVTLGMTRLCMVHMDHQGGRGTLTIVQDILAKKQLKLAATFAVNDDGSNSPQGVQLIAAPQPMVVIFQCTTTAVMPFLRAYHFAGHHSSYYHSSFTDGQAAFRTVGRDAVGWIVAQVAQNPFKHETVRLIREYQRDMRRINKTNFSYNSVEGYTNARILATALRKIQGMPTAASLRDSLENLGTVDLGGHRVSFHADKHVGSRHVELVMVGRDGNYVQ